MIFGQNRSFESISQAVAPEKDTVLVDALIAKSKLNKDADIFFYGADNSDIDLTQYGTGAHTANMKFYTNNYNVDVTQSGSTNQSYSATFNCSSNCNKTITITQQ